MSLSPAALATAASPSAGSYAAATPASPASSAGDAAALEHTLAAVLSVAAAIRDARVDTVTQKEMTLWAARLESIVSSQRSAQARRRATAAAGRQADSESPTPGRAAPAAAAATPFPGVVDRGVREARVVAAPGPAAAPPLPLVMNLCACVAAVLETTLLEVGGDRVALWIPHRGLDDEFRCLFALTREREELASAALHKGANTLESLALRTCLMLHVAPHAVVAAADGAAQDCVTLLQTIAPEAERRAVRTSARLACPLRPTATGAASGVLTFAKARAPFGEQDEGAVYRAGRLVTRLLERCEDKGVLHRCFAHGGHCDALPPLRGGAPGAAPEVREQLVYRAHTSAAGALEEVRVVAAGDDAGAVVTLREGTPVLSVLRYMEGLQAAWRASVRLNMELERACKEKETLVDSLRARVRASETAGQGHPPLLQQQQQQQQAAQPQPTAETAGERATPPALYAPAA